jgi:hypothetical protein
LLDVSFVTVLVLIPAGHCAQLVGTTPVCERDPPLSQAACWVMILEEITQGLLEERSLGSGLPSKGDMIQTFIQLGSD